MFYQTQLSKVYAGGAVDVHNQFLKFIGRLPVSSGDYVWTDGTFIFGHVPFREEPNMPSELSGYPVLGDDCRGYLSRMGNYKKYSIAQDDWIINNDRQFLHGLADINGQRVIDAEISVDGDLLAATYGVYRTNQSVTYHNHLFMQIYRKTKGHQEDQIYEVTPLNLVHAVFMQTNPYVGGEISLGVDEPDEDIKVAFYKNGKQTFSLDLKPYADLAQNLALSIKDGIMSESVKEENAVNWTQQPDPPTDFFVASTYARVVTLHLSKNGDWEAVISASSYGYCFPYLTINGSIFAGSFPNGEDTNPNDDLAECLDNFESIVFSEHSLPFSPQIAKYPPFGGKKKEDGKYTDAYKEFALGAIAYYIPLARFRHFFWIPMLFNSCLILHVKNGRVVKTIYSAAGGGSSKHSREEWTEKGKIINGTCPQFRKQSTVQENSWDFPIAEDWRFQADGLAIKSIYNTKNNKSVSISANVNTLLHGGFYEAYFQYPVRLVTVYDEFAEELAKEVTDTGNPLVLHGYWRLDPRLYYKYVKSDRFEYVEDKYPKKESNAFLSGWFRLDDENYAGDEVRLSHCFAQICDGKYIIGVKDAKLISTDGNTAETICDKLKNFRVHKLLNVAKAKK